MADEAFISVRRRPEPGNAAVNTASVAPAQGHAERLSGWYPLTWQTLRRRHKSSMRRAACRTSESMGPGCQRQCSGTRPCLWLEPGELESRGHRPQGAGFPQTQRLTADAEGAVILLCALPRPSPRPATVLCHRVPEPHVTHCVAGGQVLRASSSFVTGDATAPTLSSKSRLK